MPSGMGNDGGGMFGGNRGFDRSHGLRTKKHWGGGEKKCRRNFKQGKGDLGWGRLGKGIADKSTGKFLVGGREKAWGVSRRNERGIIEKTGKKGWVEGGFVMPFKGEKGGDGGHKRGLGGWDGWDRGGFQLIEKEGLCVKIRKGCGGGGVATRGGCGGRTIWEGQGRLKGGE